MVQLNIRFPDITVSGLSSPQVDVYIIEGRHPLAFIQPAHRFIGGLHLWLFGLL
jgi:hypothetical protein